MRHRHPFARICTLLLALLMLSAMSNCPGPSSPEQDDNGGTMDDSGSDGGAY